MRTNTKRLVIVAVIAAAFLITSAFAGDWAQEPTTYRGVAWGATVDEARDTLREAGFDPMTLDSRDKATGKKRKDKLGMRARIGEVMVTEVWSAPEPNGFEGVMWSFDSDDFGSLGETLVSKFGPPTSTTNHAIENRMGAEFTNSIWVWEGPNLVLSFTRYAGKVTTGAAFFELRSATTRKSIEQTEKAKAAKDSF